MLRITGAAVEFAGFQHDEPPAGAPFGVILIRREDMGDVDSLTLLTEHRHGLTPAVDHVGIDATIDERASVALRAQCASQGALARVTVRFRSKGIEDATVDRVVAEYRPGIEAEAGATLHRIVRVERSATRGCDARGDGEPVHGPRSSDWPSPIWLPSGSATRPSRMP